ncbi:MAG TPA: hypothetical protein VFO79_09800, partial [Xanthomonadales bacterium]|nr:hypothetical protein [Xanthomonadales bacterium]
MGYSRPFSWRDPRGNTRLLDVVECLNVTRTPQLRERVLAGTFHRVSDAQVPGGLRTIEKSFVYADFDRNQFFLVKPRQERETWPEASADLARLLGAVD